MKVKDITEGPQQAPIRKAKQIWSQIDDLLVDLTDEMLEARKMYPQDEGVERALWYLNNDEIESFVKELRLLNDGGTISRGGVEDTIARGVKSGSVKIGM